MKKNKENTEETTIETNENIDVANEADVKVEEPQVELTPEEQHQKEIEESTAKYNELNDRFLRLYSEFDNYKKRTIKERLDLIKNASEDLVTSMLPVLDDFDRALKAMETSDNIETAKEGVSLISNKLRNILTNKGLKEMESPVMQELNTDFHEAITNIPAPSEDFKGKIVDMVEKGYLLNDKVIRYAKVVIGQ
ncbi:MAG: nucleotide exchange factor GrpE [Bacteroidota bacterium]